MDLANRIYELRKKSGLSQEQLAEKMNVTRQTVSKWETAQAAPEIEKITLLSELFGVSTDWLLKGEQPPIVAAQTSAYNTNATVHKNRHKICGFIMILVGVIGAVAMSVIYTINGSKIYYTSYIGFRCVSALFCAVAVLGVVIMLKNKLKRLITAAKSSRSLKIAVILLILSPISALTAFVLQMVGCYNDMLPSSPLVHAENYGTARGILPAAFAVAAIMLLIAAAIIIAVYAKNAKKSMIAKID